MLDCLNNYIGLDGACTTVAPISGIFVNSLPGISLERVAKLSNLEQEDFQGVFDDVYTRSLIQLKADILSKMQESYKTRILLQNQLDGFFEVPFQTVASSNTYNGKSLFMLESKNVCIFVLNISIYLESVLDDTKNNIQVFDLNTGLVIDSFTFNPVVGDNSITINTRFFGNGQDIRLFFAYDGNVGDSIITSDGSATDGSNQFVHSSGSTIAIGTPVTYSNITRDGDSRGMVINYNVECSLDNFICQNREYLTTALWYLLGSNLMEDSLISTRLNKFTLNNQERTEETMNVFKEKYEDSLSNNLKNLTPGSDDFCFPCEKARTYKTMLP